MINGQVANARRALAYPSLPLGAISDMTGLVAATSVAALRPALPQALPFLVLLFCAGALLWTMVTPLRIHRSPFFHSGYRYVVVPVAAAVLTLALCAALRLPYSGSSILAFTVAWTAWIGGFRHVIRSSGPRTRVLFLGNGDLERSFLRHPRLDVRRCSTPPTSWEEWEYVVVDDGLLGDEEWQAWIVHAELGGADVMSVHKAYEVLTGRVPLEVVRKDLLAVTLRATVEYAPWKRLADVLVVLAFGPLILVASLFVALLVLLDSGRPILFTQMRMGHGGVPFRMYKFRTMRTSSEDDGPAFAATADARITPVGSFLRKFRLDELPQFWNVLKGEMSIIGPRPEQVSFAKDFRSKIPLYAYRHGVRPGITGWAQVGCGYTAAGVDETSEKLSYDLFYLKHCSPLLDALVVFRTFHVVLTGFGAR